MQLVVSTKKWLGAILTVNQHLTLGTKTSHRG
jgi:hypothetical protein